MSLGGFHRVDLKLSRLRDHIGKQAITYHNVESTDIPLETESHGTVRTNGKMENGRWTGREFSTTPCPVAA